MPKDNTDFFRNKSRWSEIKDQLLGCYLVPYFQKILMTNKPIFYVDCFAGKGVFEDGQPGSPLIALRARDTCLERTLRGTTKGKIETCFIELNHAQELSRNLVNFNNAYGFPTVVPGKYEETIDGLLSTKRGTNVFLYIDPYGIQALEFSLFKKFATYGFNSLEMLINFNSFGFFRDACRAMGASHNNDVAFQDLDDLVEYEPNKASTSKQSEDLLTKIAGGDYWKAIVTSYRTGEINGYQAERRLSTEYKQRLKQIFSYVLDMPIRLKQGQRPKYRMIHICDHEHGCFLMAQNMQKRKDELFTNIQQNKQCSLFDCTPTIMFTIENELLTSTDISQKIHKHISLFATGIPVTRFLASFVNAHGLICDFKTMYSALDELQRHGKLDIIRNPYATKSGVISTFWEESKDKHITLRIRQP